MTEIVGSRCEATGTTSVNICTAPIPVSCTKNLGATHRQPIQNLIHDSDMLVAFCMSKIDDILKSVRYPRDPVPHSRETITPPSPQIMRQLKQIS